MITLEEFERIVSGHFNCLIELGFVKHNAEAVLAMYYVPYIKNELLVRLEYSKKNDYIDVCIYNNISTVKPGVYSSKHSVSLGHLMYKYKPGYNDKQDYEAIMPKVIGFEKSVEELAKLAKQYAWDILLEKKWESWGAITNYKNPTSPEINVYYEGKKVIHKPKEE